MRDSATRLRETLEQSRLRETPGLSPELLREIADVQHAHRFDDDRREAQRQIRDAIQQALDVARVAEEQAP